MRAWLAIGLGVVYVTVAFLVPVALHIRRTGASPLHLGPANRADAISKVFLALAIVGAVATPLSHLAGLPLFVEWAWTAPVGVVVMAAGITLTVWSQQTMGKSWRIGVDPQERTALVVHGPFRLARNPVYTGVGLTAVGLVLLLPNAFAAFTLLAVAVGLQILVRAVEEPYLVRIHGEPYVAYASQTGRFVPRLGRLSVALEG
jgi:protein-S-isoprenylcysteine O-methyltransferase Ste14